MVARWWLGPPAVVRTPGGAAHQAWRWPRPPPAPGPGRGPQTPVPGHEPLQVDLAVAERLKRFEAFEEALSGGEGLSPREDRRRSRVGMWLRSTHLVVSPRARCSPVRTCVASGNTAWTAWMYGWWWSLTTVVGVDARSGQRPAEERLGGRGVPVVAEQDVEHLAVLVDGSVEVALLLAPSRKKKTSSTYHRPGRRRCFRTSAASRGPKVCTQRSTVRWETSIPRSARRTMTLVADSGWPRYHRTADQDDLRRPAVAGEGGRRGGRERAAAGSTDEALAAGAVTAVALGGGTLTRGTQWHEARTVPATDDVADSRPGRSLNGPRGAGASSRHPGGPSRSAVPALCHPKYGY